MSKEFKSYFMPVLASLFAALISVGAYVVIPIGGSPVPIVLQNAFILLSGLVLGPFWGVVAVFIYLIAGVLGLPVFSGGGKGLAVLLGPTGGYLASYPFVAVFVGFFTRWDFIKLWHTYLVLTIAVFFWYVGGVLGLRFALDISWTKAVGMGVLPFLIGDGIKVAFVGVLGWKIKKTLKDIML